MGKGRKGFHKEYSPPEEKFIVVVNAWGRSDNRQSYANNVAAWFEIMLRRCYSKEKPQIFRIWYQNTHETLIVELPEVVTDLQPFLGVHPYSTFLINVPGSDQCATLYEYNFARFDHPERRNWREVSPTYSRIPPNFPVRDPYPLPRDIEFHLFVPPPQPPINVPYAIPVPIPAIPRNLPPPPAPPSKCITPANQNARPSQVNTQALPQRSSSLSAQPSLPPSSSIMSVPPAPQPENQPTHSSPHPASRLTPAFTPYVPPSHHPSHSILTEARARGHTQRGRDQQPDPLPIREEPQAAIPKKKMDLDPYEEEEVARKLLSMSRPQSEFPQQGERHGQSGSVTSPRSSSSNGQPNQNSHAALRQSSQPSRGLLPDVKAEPTDVGLPPRFPGHSSRAPPASSTLQPNAGVKSEEAHPVDGVDSASQIIGFPTDGGSVTGDAGAREAGEDDDEYEPSAALLDALGDFGEFAGVLGTEAGEPCPAEPTPATILQSNQSGTTTQKFPSHGQVRVKPEPMDEDNLLAYAQADATQAPSSSTSHIEVKAEPMDNYLSHERNRRPEASPTARPTASWVRVKPEPMDEDHCLPQQQIRGPEASPTARPIPPRVHLKPEPMDEDYSFASTSTRGTSPPSRDCSRNRGARGFDGCDDSRHTRGDSDSRRTSCHSGRDDRYRHGGPSSNTRSPDTSHSHAYSSPKAGRKSLDRRGDGGLHVSGNSSSRKRDSSSREGWYRERERHEDSNKRPRMKAEPRD